MPSRARAATVLSTLAILFVSAAVGLMVDWNASGLGRYARDWLMRARGPLPVPDDIAIVAIDEASMARFGRFPWSRRVLARTVDAIAADKPKVIALDILFTDPTAQDDDDALARSIGRAGNVVVAAQLTDSPVHGGPSRWLLPIPSIERAAAAVGHVNVQTEQDGAARQIAVRLADDSGRAIRAMPIETVRVGDGIPEEGVTDTGSALLVGPRIIRVDTTAPSVLIEPSHSIKVLRGGRMTIDYIGPAGSFNPVTVSLADVVSGSVPPDKLHDKYVLIGATAASIGERLASPFVRYTDARADQHGALMPGVEVLANAVNSILRGRFYTDVSSGAAFFWAVIAAALTLFLLEGAQGGHEVLKQTGALVGVAALILLGCYLSFTLALVVPPIVPCFVAYGCAGILTLLRRSLVASARLDRNITELAVSGDLLAPAGPGIPGAYQWGEGGPVSLARGWLPKGLEWKARTLSELNARLLDRARFVNFALRSVEDGLIIAGPGGVITFANRAAGEILGSPARGLVGQDLAQRLAGTIDAGTLERLLAERGRIEREFTVRDSRPRHFTLRLAAVSADEAGAGPLLGIVASFSDITRQHELQQTKNDVISLVSHEMRTPLTAIQGMTELLANYDVPGDRRREMNLAINDEVKRLTRMITEYLDITRLESGATQMRLSAVRAESLLERILILLDPVAAARHIRLTRRFQPGLPPILADPDLLSRALENLVSNAVKYSPDAAEIIISARAEEEALLIEVIDHGYGIPPADLERVFEKFYRVPRVQDAGTPGTGLGLAFVREIAELHRGTVAVRSELNHGSTFSLRIPREKTS
ncbi:MAG TPA: CHASE2 domain-containing protein [Candidatus Acidoferrales bacterium]|nr:CHASE2 domain-containing protein [Candidatus Acidoferrales bacterium]